MCGIGGIVTTRGAGLDPAWLGAIEAAMRHRGPDGVGFLGWRREEPDRLAAGPLEACAGAAIGLTHRRLAIIDPSEAGAQPMVSPCGRHAIVFNGEVYNFVELRQRLEKLGHRFRGHSDTEVVLAALIEWGPKAALSQFTGMFALAWLDLDRQRLVLARDPFGIKPLYLARWNGHLAFASELPSLLALPGLSRQPDRGMISDYLVHGRTDRGRRTFFAGLERFPPGHWLELDLAGQAKVEAAPYLSITPSTRLDLSFDEAAAHLRDLFLNSVTQHLRSDVPVGVTLSGGIDSSAIVMAMRAVGGDRVDLHGFGYRAETAALDEGRWMSLAAERAGAILHTTTPHGTNLAADLAALVAQQAEPFPTTSIYAQSCVYRLARETGIKVTLDGQGADELFAGYPTYIGARLASALCTGEVGTALSLLKAGGLRAGARALPLMLPPGLQRLLLRAAGKGEAPSWLDPEWARDEPGLSVPRYRRRDRFHDRLEQTLFDLSLPALLRFCDRNSMAHSVESRLPFLTTEMARFALSLPADYLVDRDATTKSVFRRAMRGLVPDPILDRRDKIGFVTPEGVWLEQMGAELAELAAGALPMLKPALVRAACDRAQAGDAPRDGRVWRWLNLLLWSRSFDVRL
jgi:asparagine synthase (glutamine-hydrolysing)